MPVANVGHSCAPSWQAWVSRWRGWVRLCTLVVSAWDTITYAWRLSNTASFFRVLPRLRACRRLSERCAFGHRLEFEDLIKACKAERSSRRLDSSELAQRLDAMKKHLEKLPAY